VEHGSGFREAERYVALLERSDDWPRVELPQKRRSMTTYAEFFKAATGSCPYPYQAKFATRDEMPSLVSVPTCCGKTVAVILGWLWRGRFAGPELLEASDDRVFVPSGG
jgi:hypothetical protein